MKAEEILAYVDHTLLKQTATWADIQRICDEAVKYHTATVMVPSSYVPRIVAEYRGHAEGRDGRRLPERQLQYGSKDRRDGTGARGRRAGNRHGHQHRHAQGR